MTLALSQQHNRVVIDVHLDDPRVQPMIAELTEEYLARYADLFGEESIRNEVHQYPAEEFAPPIGGLILILEDGVPIAGGAFRPRSEVELGDLSFSSYPHRARTAGGAPGVATAELKRIWTSREHRRKGLGVDVIHELETRIKHLGYQRIYLTTGPRQPEAEALYVKTGYTRLYQVEDHYETPLPFEKWLIKPTD